MKHLKYIWKGLITAIGCTILIGIAVFIICGIIMLIAEFAITALIISVLVMAYLIGRSEGEKIF